MGEKSFCRFPNPQNKSNHVVKQAIIDAASYVPPPPSEEQKKKIAKMCELVMQIIYANCLPLLFPIPFTLFPVSYIFIVFWMWALILYWDFAGLLLENRNASKARRYFQTKRHLEELVTVGIDRSCLCGPLNLRSLYM